MNPTPAMEQIVLTQKEFDELLEYSCSLPTGTTIGKKWKKNRFAFTRFDDGVKRQEWYLLEYVEHKEPGMVGINTKRIIGIGALRFKKWKV